MVPICLSCGAEKPASGARCDHCGHLPEGRVERAGHALAAGPGFVLFALAVVAMPVGALVGVLVLWVLLTG